MKNTAISRRDCCGLCKTPRGLCIEDLASGELLLEGLMDLCEVVLWENLTSFEGMPGKGTVGP